MKINNLNTTNLVAVSFDGASSMSGTHGGKQALLLHQISPGSLFVHCRSRVLQLAFVKAASTVSVIKLTLNMLNKPYTLSTAAANDYWCWKKPNWLSMAWTTSSFSQAKRDGYRMKGASWTTSSFSQAKRDGYRMKGAPQWYVVIMRLFVLHLKQYMWKLGTFPVMQVAYCVQCEQTAHCSTYMFCQHFCSHERNFVGAFRPVISISSVHRNLLKL